MALQLTEHSTVCGGGVVVVVRSSANQHTHLPRVIYLIHQKVRGQHSNHSHNQRGTLLPAKNAAKQLVAFSCCLQVCVYSTSQDVPSAAAATAACRHKMGVKTRTNTTPNK